ncbi:MAG: hypothetical protein IK063_01155, partial [Clostridia bacterium]|nr:hypothetical protein [Clostridia bacterium]
MSLMNPKTLIVVYKNELFSNQIKKLIETDDDIDDDNIVGVKDGSVKVVSWDEKTWADQKKTGKIASKVLFIGNIKGSGKLLPLVDYKYDQFGVKYGWAGSQAIVMAEAKALSKKEDYEAFLKAFSLLSEKTIGEIKAEENAEDEQPAEDVSDQTNEETAGKNVSY